MFLSLNKQETTSKTEKYTISHTSEARRQIPRHSFLRFHPWDGDDIVQLTEHAIINKECAVGRIRDLNNSLKTFAEFHCNPNIAKPKYIYVWRRDNLLLMFSSVR